MMLLNPKGNMNLHTHTCFCDGKDEPEEMVKKAIDLGFSVLGKHEMLSRRSTASERGVPWAD